jgi:hypothetical protein
MGVRVTLGYHLTLTLSRARYSANPKGLYDSNPNPPSGYGLLLAFGFSL